MTWVRPRGQAWGDEPQRAVLHAIAEDVARRTSHRVVAIEAVRSDGYLEFVAIAGDPVAREEMLGRASPLSLEQFLRMGTPLEGWLHLPAERLDDEARAWMLEYGHVPDRPVAVEVDGWHPEDQLVRLLTNSTGDLRALLYLDEPLSGLRPTSASLAAINAEIAVMYDALVSIVERELYGEQVRMLTQVRTAMRSVRPGLGVTDLLPEMSTAMVATMTVDAVDVLLAGEEAPHLEPHAAELEDRMRQVWHQRGHLVVEPDQTWGGAEHASPTPAIVRTAMERQGLGSWLLIPIGMGDDYLGTIGFGRVHGGPRWIDSEINAAIAVASDMARLVADARLMEREQAVSAEWRDISEYRRDMVVTLAHELRTPVSVLWTHLELLRQEPTLEAVADALPAMDRAARRIENMVEDLMALARATDPTRPAPRDPVDLSVLVTECGDFFATKAAADEIDLRVQVVAGLVVTGDAAGLQRVVVNLVSNALKYSGAGDVVTLSLVPERRHDRDGVLLCCQDTGMGMSAADVKSMFVPFFRSSSPAARQQRGTGLGLTVVERVVKGHAGEVRVDSVLGRGTTVGAWVPVDVVHDGR